MIGAVRPTASQRRAVSPTSRRVAERTVCGALLALPSLRTVGFGRECVRRLSRGDRRGTAPLPGPGDGLTGKSYHAALRARGDRWLEILWHCLTRGVLYDEAVRVSNRRRALGRAA